MSLPLFASSATPHCDGAQRGERLASVARQLAADLAAGATVSRASLTRLMTETFGGSDAEGRWTLRQAYDALEGAVVMHLATGAIPMSAAQPDILMRLERLQASLPTQTYRSEDQIALQQFSTPPVLAWLTALAACMVPDDCLLEPSAGTGMLAIFGHLAGARLILNELDPSRAALLAGCMSQPVTTHDAGMIDNLLPPEGRPSVILMNPPFGRSEGLGIDRHAGARHLRAALTRLAPGGRLVAIMPRSFASDGPASLAYQTIRALVPPRVEMTILGCPFAKHGTGIDVRLLVFDKGWSGTASRHEVPTAAAALPLICALPCRLPLGPPPQPTPVARACLPQLRPRGGGGLLSGLGSGCATPPVRHRPPDDPAVPLAYQVRAEPRGAAEPVGVYVPWRLARIDIYDARPHPDQLVESVAMASVDQPVTTYRPLLQRRAVQALSDAQLETVILAGAAFERDLGGTFKPNEAGDQLVEVTGGQAYRTGYFIGDGTGVGKGRQAAGCIRDQWNQNRRKAVWISKSSALIEDARRDWAALGGLSIDIQPLDAFPLGTAIGMDSGILFLTYATLRSARDDQLTRLQQILAWLGPDHEGMIVFDEAHAMANAAGTESDFGSARGSEQGLAGVRLQNALPRARILYISATGATDPANLCYAARLGLWGPETAFRDRSAFLAAMDEGGIAAMEIVARDLKAMGLYTARALSFAGVEYEPLEHQLTADQIRIYDAYADAWGVIHRNLDEVMKATNIVDRMSGDVLNARARGAALSRFESAKQRFFGQLLVSMKVPTLIRAIEQVLAKGQSAVVQLVTTAEAILDHRLAELSATDRASLDIDLSPREHMIDYLKKAFPTRMMRVFRASDGALRSELMTDVDGIPIVCREAVATRDALIEELCAMPPVAIALDALAAHFGADCLAEVTGRSRRILVDAQGRQKIERRSARANLAETEAFMAGEKRILAFSDAGGTGRSYHADTACPSAGRRRVHFLLEPGWKAAAAIQGLGRTHRTNQASPPIFRPVTTDCKGERRFISTIARRLDGLGALTRGQRQTGGQNLFDPADNLESDHAREALIQWYHLLHAGKLTSTTLANFTEMTGLALVNADSGMLLDRLPPIQRWLNRILALRIGVQNAIFDEYLGLIEARIDAAREAGTLDIGVETIQSEQTKCLSDQVLRRDPVTQAETRLCRLELHRRPRTTSFQHLMALWGGTRDIAFMRNGRSGKVALRVPSWSVTDAEGRPVAMCQLVRPTGQDRMAHEALAGSHWRSIPLAAFEQIWECEVEDAAARLDVEVITVATGLLLPVWHRLPNDDVRVWRISTGDGGTILGRIVLPGSIEALATAFGIDAAPRLAAGELVRAASSPDGVALPGSIAGRLVAARVNDSRRLEIRGFRAEDREWLKARGCFSEVIAYKTRLFVPVDAAESVLADIISAH